MYAENRSKMQKPLGLKGLRNHSARNFRKEIDFRNWEDKILPTLKLPAAYKYQTKGQEHTCTLACEQAPGLRFFLGGGRGGGEGKERELAAMSQKFECLR